MSLRRSQGAKLLAAASAVALLLSPAAFAQVAKRKVPAVSVGFDPLSTFTPASADPRLAASFAGRGAPTLTELKFTPAASKARPSQVRVAIRARAADTARSKVVETAGLSSASPVSAITPASYNLGASVGWRRFAVSGDVAKSSPAESLQGARETAVVGVSYSIKRFTGKVAVGADRTDSPVVALRQPDTYSLDVGGAYNITSKIAVTGGVRYRVDHDRLNTVQDDRRDSQAVYVGTAFKF